jgi:hypothetical protein
MSKLRGHTSRKITSCNKKSSAELQQSEMQAHEKVRPCHPKGGHGDHQKQEQNRDSETYSVCSEWYAHPAKV